MKDKKSKSGKGEFKVQHRAQSYGELKARLGIEPMSKMPGGGGGGGGISLSSVSGRSTGRVPNGIANGAGIGGSGKGASHDEKKKPDNSVGVTKPFRNQVEIKGRAIRTDSSHMRHRMAVHYKGIRAGKSWGQRPGRLISTDGARIRSIVKNRWVSKRDMSNRHLKRFVYYLQNRDRSDVEKKEDRKYFTKDRNDLDWKEVEQEMKGKLGRWIQFHKMIVSPGDNSINLKGYIREIVAQWEQVLGKAIDYYAVIHQNTDHNHVHLLIPGRVEGSREDLQFNPEQLAGLRFLSDEFIARDRDLDKEFDRNIDINNGFMWRRFDTLDKLMGIGQDWFHDWLDQVDLGLKTKYDDDKLAQEFGLGKVYDLGKPFDNVRVLTPEQIAQLKKQDGYLDPKVNPERDQDPSLLRDWQQDDTPQMFEKYQSGPGQVEQSREITKNEPDEAGDKKPDESKDSKKRDDER